MFSRKGAKTQSDGWSPSFRAETKNLKKISPFGRNDIFFLPLRLCALAGDIPSSNFALFALFAVNSPVSKVWESHP
jgi:hypothetical protein